MIKCDNSYSVMLKIVIYKIVWMIIVVWGKKVNLKKWECRILFLC